MNFEYIFAGKLLFLRSVAKSIEKGKAHDTKYKYSWRYGSTVSI